MSDLREEHAIRISPDNDCFVYGKITRLAINDVELDIADVELTIDEENIVRKRYRVFPIDIGPGASTIDVTVQWEE